MKIRKHKKIKDAFSYIKHNIDEILIYKKSIEEEIETLYPDHYRMVLKNIVPIIECLDLHERSYENLLGQNFWIEKILELKEDTFIGCSGHRKLCSLFC